MPRHTYALVNTLTRTAHHEPDINNMNLMKANGNDLVHTENKISVPDIIMSATDINTDAVRGLSVDIVEGSDDLPIAAAASSLTQTDNHAVVTEEEIIFMSDLNQMIDQYNAKNRQQAEASTSCLPQKRPSSSLTVTHTRRKESTGMLQKDASSTIVYIDFKD